MNITTWILHIYTAGPLYPKNIVISRLITTNNAYDIEPL